MDMDENDKAKREFIKAYHDNAESRIAFLCWLHAEKHQYEALTLCTSYIDSFSQLLCWPSFESGKNFVQTVIDFGGNPLMELIHPLQAIRTFESMKSFWKSIAKKIQNVFPGLEYELISEKEFLAKLTTKLTPEELQKLKVTTQRKY